MSKIVVFSTISFHVTVHLKFYITSQITLALIYGEGNIIYIYLDHLVHWR